MNTNKQINIMVLLVFIAVFATGAYTLWDPTRADDAEEKQLEGTLERGAYLFSQNCRTCHGDAGEGGAASNRLRLAPALNRGDLRGEDPQTGEVTVASRAQAYKLVFNTINCGRVGKAMPTWGQEHGGTLNDEQIRQLALLITEGTQETWDLAKEFAVEGVPEFDLHGDAFEAPRLTADVSADDTTLPLSSVEGLGEESRLLIGEEIVEITAVDEEASTAEVERGVGTTDPAEHGPDTEILKQPSAPPDPAPTTPPACGQYLPAAVPTAAPEPPSATLSIIALNIAWNKSALTAIAGVPLTITVDNQDVGIPHNIHFFVGAEPGGDSVAQTDIEVGPIIQTLNFGPLEAGEYYYVCDVHPQMEGVLTAVAQ